MKFDETYTRYWESTVHKSVDGLTIPGARHVNHILKVIGIKGGAALDLGCSTGRLQPALSVFFDQVYGVEPDPYAVAKAEKLSYRAIHNSTAECTGYPDGFFDFVFCWAVFDVVDDTETLIEINRILKIGGRVLITGKSNNYDPQDNLALIAEANAFLKGFPGKFHNIGSICSSLDIFGFSASDLLVFKRRGDMGLLKYERLCLSELSDSPICCYEWLLVARKTGFRPTSASCSDLVLSHSNSQTSVDASSRAGFSTVEQYFKSIGTS